MSPLQEAIALLNTARDKIEGDAHERAVDSPDRQDLDDVAATIGELLFVLESFDKPKED